jgi:hypothetical protein
MPRTRDREMPLRSLAKQLFDALPRQLTRRNAPRTSDPQSADISGNDCTRGLEPNFGALLYLVSLGIVAIATVVVFFGVGFLLLTPPNEQLIAALDTRDRGVEIEHQSFDLAPSPDKNGALSTTQTASASSVSPAKIPAPHYDVLPPASRDTAVGSAPAADTGAAKTISDASLSSQNPPGLRSDMAEAAVATPTGITSTKSTEIRRHRHPGARKHWAAMSRPGANGRPPPAISGPERAWQWIVQSTTGLLAALSPPPLLQAPGPKTRWRAD